MKLVLVIVLFVADATVALPAHCNACNAPDAATCTARQQNQTCATSRNSLGTTHCGTAAIKYQDSNLNVRSGFIRGCFDCADKKAACFALGGALKTFSYYPTRTLLQCELECCTGSYCNTQQPTVTQNAITVFTPNADGPNQCQRCFRDDRDTCTLSQYAQTCSTNRDSLGKTHCGSAVINYRNSLSGRYVNDSVFRGCINCEDKKAACAAISGYLKGRNFNEVLECEIECCNSSDCNDGAADLAKCNHCNERDEARCSSNQRRQICTLQPETAFGTSHCGSAVGKYRDQNGIVRDLFYRGCFDCTDKRAACFTLGGYLKGDVDNAGKITLLQCDIECCNASNGYCNTQKPILQPAAVTVFTPTVSGPSQCNVCLESNSTDCSKNQQTQVCATNPYSLGTTHCASAVGKYRNSKGNVVEGFFRGCINCADKKAACAAIGGFRKNVQKWTQLECEIECCTAVNCNTQIPTLSKGASQTNGPKKNTASSSQEVYHFLFSGLLVFATAAANIGQHF